MFITYAINDRKKSNWMDDQNTHNIHADNLRCLSFNHLVFQVQLMQQEHNFVKQDTKRATSWTQKDDVTYNSSSLLHCLAVWVTNVLLKVPCHSTTSFWCLHAHSFANLHCHYKVCPTSISPNHVINFST